MEVNAQEVLSHMGGIVSEMAQRLALTEAKESQYKKQIERLQAEVKELEEELDERANMDMVSDRLSPVSDHIAGGA